nr:MAG TPA: hypothetical protein [Caudoviricetes sp.]
MHNFSLKSVLPQFTAFCVMICLRLTASHHHFLVFILSRSARGGTREITRS